MKMTNKDLEGFIRKIGIENVVDLSEDDKIFVDLMLNSIEIVMLICSIEDYYDIEFDVEQLEFEENLTVGHFLKKINALLEG